MNPKKDHTNRNFKTIPSTAVEIQLYFECNLIDWGNSWKTIKEILAPPIKKKHLAPGGGVLFFAPLPSGKRGSKNKCLSTIYL